MKPRLLLVPNDKRRDQGGRTWDASKRCGKGLKSIGHKYEFFTGVFADCLQSQTAQAAGHVVAEREHAGKAAG